MLEPDYLRQQAEICSQLSRATFDLGVAGRLRTLAEELRRKAIEIEQDQTMNRGRAAASVCRRN